MPWISCNVASGVNFQNRHVENKRQRQQQQQQQQQQLQCAREVIAYSSLWLKGPWKFHEIDGVLAIHTTGAIHTTMAIYRRRRRSARSRTLGFAICQQHSDANAPPGHCMEGSTETGGCAPDRNPWGNHIDDTTTKGAGKTSESDSIGTSPDQLLRGRQPGDTEGLADQTTNEDAGPPTTDQPIGKSPVEAAGTAIAQPLCGVGPRAKPHSRTKVLEDVINIAVPGKNKDGSHYEGQHQVYAVNWAAELGQGTFGKVYIGANGQPPWK